MSRIVDVASADNLLSQSAMCPTDWHFELVFKKAHINLRMFSQRIAGPVQMDWGCLFLKWWNRFVYSSSLSLYGESQLKEIYLFFFFCDRFYVWSFVWVWSGSKSPYSANVSFHSEIIFQQLFWFVQFC